MNYEQQQPVCYVMFRVTVVAVGCAAGTFMGSHYVVAHDIIQTKNVSRQSEITLNSKIIYKRAAGA